MERCSYRLIMNMRQTIMMPNRINLRCLAHQMPKFKRMILSMMDSDRAILSRKEGALQTMKNFSGQGSYRSIFIVIQTWKKDHIIKSISDRETSDTPFGMITVKMKELEEEISNSIRSNRD